LGGFGFGLDRIGSIWLSKIIGSRVGSGWVSGLLVSGRFRFQVVSSQIGSIFGLSSIGSFRISDHIKSGRVRSVIESSSVGSYQVGSGRLSGHFRFRVISSHIGLVIGSFIVRSFQILNHIRLDRIGSYFTIYVSDLFRSDESYQIEFLSDACLSHVDFTLISIKLNSFEFISSILNLSSSIQYKFHLKDMLNCW
jgi:hypothetical protein